eukprot:COSAG02_NODE_60345_length_271_cov_1.186047_1_plen_26_part_10
MKVKGQLFIPVCESMTGFVSSHECTK